MFLSNLTRHFIENSATYQIPLTVTAMATTLPKTAPTITQNVIIPNIPDRFHLVGMIKNIYGMPKGIP